jgi:hypothetical protein
VKRGIGLLLAALAVTAVVVVNAFVGRLLAQGPPPDAHVPDV